MQIELKETRFFLSFSFAAVVTLMLLLCDEEVVLISLFSSFFHEAGHLLFMYLFSCKPARICFGAFGIRIERGEGRPLSYKKEAVVALGGIFGNCLLIFCGLFFYLICKSTRAYVLVAVNVFVAAFNMLPIRLLDFGRFLECIFALKLQSERAEKVLSRISLATAIFIAVFCIAYNFFVGINVSLIAVSIYIILVTTLKE